MFVHFFQNISEGGELKNKILQELLCSLCQDILRNPVCIKNCLHRFCEECLSENFRHGWRTCPICRGTFVNKRAVATDLLAKNVLALINNDAPSEMTKSSEPLPRDDPPSNSNDEFFALPASTFGGPDNAFYICTIDTAHNICVPVDNVALHLNEKNQLII